MPTISMSMESFIRMYCSPGEHNPPHIHAYYQEFMAIVSIITGEVTTGSLPLKPTKLVLACVGRARMECCDELEDSHCSGHLERGGVVGCGTGEASQVLAECNGISLLSKLRRTI
ncbi:MAG: DUF4160 domain-containing protein [Deltaproteobacteria bacterium]|nr:DUF4160 domain-containing protein [Deltaproteobacteria bacterium]